MVQKDEGKQSQGQNSFPRYYSRRRRSRRSNYLSEELRDYIAESEHPGQSAVDLRLFLILLMIGLIIIGALLFLDANSVPPLNPRL